MKFTKRILSIACALLVSSSAMFSQTTVQAPFTKGVNLSKWFEIWKPGIPNLRVYDKSDFVHLKELGCDVVRVPIHFAMFLEDDDSGKIKDIIFEYLDQACDWAEELGMYIIIDNHSFNSGKYPTSKEVRESLETVWPQIAKRYKKRSKYIVYEILNEPQFSNKEWEPIQQDILKLIRKTDKKHNVVLTGANWSSVGAMCELQPVKDKNVIYTFHFYDPFVFTHQGADWTDKGTAALSNVPFPYDAEKMPELPAAAKGTSAERTIRYTYQKDGTVTALENQIKKVVEFSKKANAPVWCGEMGVHDLVAPEDSRNFWYKAMGELFENYKVAFTVWGYDDTFGIFKPKSKKQYPRDLNVEVLEGLGMNIPEGAGDESLPIKSSIPLTIYDDWAGKGINLTTWSMNFFIDNYAREKSEGTNSIMLGFIDQYGALAVDLSKIYLADIKGNENNTYLTFDVKFTDSKQAFQVRFVDTDDGLGTDIIPWRLSYDVKASDLEVGEWNKIEIPLSSMGDYGGWSNLLNQWFDGKGEFSFARVEKLEFAAENASIKEMFYLDNIRIIQK